MSAAIIYFLNVLSPILAKRIMKTVITSAERMPPVVVLYYVSPLYLTSLLEGNKSTYLKLLQTRL